MSPRRNAIVVAAVLALAGAGWLAWRASESPARVAVAAPASATAPTPSSAVSEPTPRARLAAAQAQLRGATAGGCSVRLAGWSTRAASEASEVEESDAMKRTPGYDAFRASIARIDDKLRSSADPYGQAVAIWLNLPRREGDDASVSREERTRLLASMAASTNDPRIYALAFPLCRDSTENGCYALSARRWAEADAGNAEPWEYLLDEAVLREDVSGQEEALFHIARSARADQRSLMPVTAITAAADRNGGDAAVPYVLSVMAIGTSAAQFEPLWVMSSLCRPKERSNANRAQLCARIADLMFEHADDSEGRLLGADLNWHITGDTTRRDRVRAERAMEATLFKDPVPATCDQLRQRTDWLRDLALHGPQAVARAMTAPAPASDVTPPSPARTPARTSDPASSRS